MIILGKHFSTRFLKYSQMPLSRGPLHHDITYIIIMTTEHELSFERMRPVSMPEEAGSAACWNCIHPSVRYSFNLLQIATIGGETSRVCQIYC